MMQKTLSKAISFEGNALHTGEVVKVDLIPKRSRRWPNLAKHVFGLKESPHGLIIHGSTTCTFR